MTTIKDLMISPFEIDVDNHNFTVVEVTKSKGGIVAGKKTEAGNEQRKIVGHYGTLALSLSRIAEERLRGTTPSLDNRVVNLKEFMAEIEARKQLFLKWAKFLTAPFMLDPETLPVVSPKDYLKKAGQAVEEEAE